LATVAFGRNAQKENRWVPCNHREHTALTDYLISITQSRRNPKLPKLLEMEPFMALGA